MYSSGKDVSRNHLGVHLGTQSVQLHCCWYLKELSGMHTNTGSCVAAAALTAIDGYLFLLLTFLFCKEVPSVFSVTQTTGGGDPPYVK